MKSNRFLLSIFLLSLLFFTPISKFWCGGLSAQSKADLTSGPKSLLVVCQKLGVTTTLDEIKRLSDYDEVKGTTMEGLYKAAKSKGLYADGMKISLDGLSKLTMPIIAYLWDNHCLVIDGFEGDSLRVIDPPREPYSISKEKFAEDYSGFSLLISKDKTPFPKIDIKGPDIRFEEYSYNFGVVEQWEEDKVEHVFKFKNAGNKDLIISQVRALRACCGSSAPLLSEKNIPPKGEGEIKATFYVGGKRGSQDYSFSVYSNDPITPMVKLQIKGFVDAEPIKTNIKTKVMVFPKNINFGNLNKGTVASKKIHILKPEDEGLSITKIESSSKYLSVKISPKENRSYKGIEKNYQSFELEVTLSPDISVGKLEEKIIIYITSEKQSQIEIPVYALVVGE